MPINPITLTLSNRSQTRSTGESSVCFGKNPFSSKLTSLKDKCQFNKSKPQEEKSEEEIAIEKSIQDTRTYVSNVQDAASSDPEKYGRELLKNIKDQAPEDITSINSPIVSINRYYRLGGDFRESLRQIQALEMDLDAKKSQPHNLVNEFKPTNLNKFINRCVDNDDKIGIKCKKENIYYKNMIKVIDDKACLYTLVYRKKYPNLKTDKILTENLFYIQDGLIFNFNKFLCGNDPLRIDSAVLGY